MKQTTILAGFLGLCLAGPANALVVETWTRRSVQFTNLGRAEVSATATGLATLNTSSATSSHLSTLSVTVNPGLRVTMTVPASDPDLPQVTGVVPAFQSRPDLQGGGVIGNVSGAIASSAGGLTPATIPSTGGSTICLLVVPLPPCVAQLNLLMGGTTPGGFVGNGVGGLLTIDTYNRISLLGAPFTVKSVSVVNRTANGGFDLFVEHGFAHGPASLTSSTAQISGVLQMITASRTLLGAVVGAPDQIGQISRTLIHVVPEPGLLLLFAAGAGGLLLLGRKRIRRR